MTLKEIIKDKIESSIDDAADQVLTAFFDNFNRQMNKEEIDTITEMINIRLIIRKVVW